MSYVPLSIKTIEDLEKAIYGGSGLVDIVKASGAVSTSTTGVYNPRYGAFAWSLLNQEANAFGVLPKYPWHRSGWRMIVARAAESGGGVAEGGAIPSPIRPEFIQVSTKPKTIAHTFEITTIQEALAETEDDIYATVEQMKIQMAIHHKEMINRMLLEKVEPAGSVYDPSTRLDFETLDRIISSHAEASAYTPSGGENWYDVYGLDRDSETKFDAVVSFNEASPGTNRDLTNDLIIDFLADIRQKGGKDPTVFITGHDTYKTIQSIYTSLVMYTPLGYTDIQVGVNGIQTAKGLPVGIHVATLYGIPIITSKDTPKDGISRIYALDTSDPEGFGMPRIGIKVLRPTQYFEIGENPLLVGSFVRRGLYRTMGEAIAASFLGHGKLRDLK